MVPLPDPVSRRVDGHPRGRPLLLPLHRDPLGREVEKLVSLSASIATGAFTHAAGEPVAFDSRIWMGTILDEVVDYLSWRQANAARCALNGWCYWTLRNEGRSARQATRELERTSVSGKNELLYARGINFQRSPDLAATRRGALVGEIREARPRPDSGHRRGRHPPPCPRPTRTPHEGRLPGLRPVALGVELEFVAPVPEGLEDWAETSAMRGEGVLRPGWPSWLAASFQYTPLDEMRQAVGQHLVR